MRLATLFIASFLLISRVSAAQIPPPVMLPIENILQQTPVWCWVAVAQQIIAASVGQQQTPSQCALVAMAYGAAPAMCCSGYNPQCVTVGSMSQIQLLIAQFGRHYSAIAPPTNPMALYQTLSNGHPVIMEVQTSPSSTHVVVLRGMAFSPSPMGLRAVLYLNDPMSYFTQPVPFENIVGIWRDAIVVQ